MNGHKGEASGAGAQTAMKTPARASGAIARDGYGRPGPESRPGSQRPAALRRERLIVLATLVGLTILYASLADYFNGFHAFWSPDSGARFAMIQNWLRHGSLTSLTYDDAAVDPTGRLHPLPNYVFQGPKGFSVMYPPLFAGLCGLAFRVWGFGGLTVLPLAGGIAALWVTYLTAARLGLRCRAALPLLMGLGTPIVVYSVVFWKHSLIMLLAAATAYFLLRALQTKRLFFAVAAGTTLGIGIWVQELLLFLFAAILFTSLPLLREVAGRRLVFGLVSAFSILLALWLVSNQALYGFWGGAHMMMGVHWVTNLAGAKAGSQGEAFHSGMRQGLSLGQIGARALLQLVGTEPGDRRGLFPLASLGAVSAAALLPALLPRRAGGVWTSFLPPLLYIAACIAAARLVRYGSFASGLFEVTAVLVPALAVPWFVTGPLGVRQWTRRASFEKNEFEKNEAAVPDAPEPQAASPSKPLAAMSADVEADVEPDNTVARRRLGGDRAEGGEELVFYAWMSRACWAFALLVIVNPVPPGLDWGSRYLLTTLPLLVLLSAKALETQHFCDPSRGQRPLGVAAKVRGTATAVAGAGLIGVSIACQCCGLAAVRNDLVLSRNLNLAARSLTTSLLVTDIDWIGPELTAFGLPEKQAFVRSEADEQFLLSTLSRKNTPEFTYMGTQGGCVALTQAASQASLSFRPAALWNDRGLQFAHFVQFAHSVRQPPRAPRTRHVLALYYPWYGTPARSGQWLHQEPDELDPRKMADHAHFPALGPYDSTDPAVIERHLQQAQDAGIDTLVCSWWGRTDRTDRAIRLLLRRAPAHSLKVCVLWEQLNPQEKSPGERNGNPKAGLKEKPVGNNLDAVLSDLTYLLGTLARSPAYLRDAGRPVVFLYSGVSRGLPPGGWTTVVNQAIRQAPPGVELIGMGQSPSDLLVCGGFYGLAPSRSFVGASLADCTQIQGDTYWSIAALAREADGVRVETVLPGIDDRRVDDGIGMPRGTLVDRQGGALYQALWEQTLRDVPDWVLVNSFNQWHAGTEIEPSLEMGDAYLALTRKFAHRFKDLPTGDLPAKNAMGENTVDKP